MFIHIFVLILIYVCANDDMSLLMISVSNHFSYPFIRIFSFFSMFNSVSFPLS